MNISRRMAYGLAVSCAVLSSAQLNAGAVSKHMYHGRVSASVMTADKLLQKGKFAAAADFYNKALAKDPKDDNARIGLGMALAKQFKLDGADDQFNKVLAENPNDAGAHVGKAMVLLNRLQSSSGTIRNGRDATLKEAESESQKALDADKQTPEAHYTMGMVLREQGRLNEADQQFKESVNLDPKFGDGFDGQGLIKLQQGNAGGALSDFRQAIKVNTGDYTAHYGAGQSLLKQGQTDAGIKELNTALYQFPNSWPVNLALGDAYRTQGNTVAAISKYQEAIRIKPETSAAYLGIADIRETRGDLEHSIAELRSGLDLMPNDPNLHQRVGDESLRLEKVDDAIKEFTTVMNMQPGNSRAADGLTNAYYLKAQKETTGGFFGSNDFEDAEHLIDRAVQMNPNDMRLRLAQAKIKSLSGDAVDLKSIGQPQNDGERVSFAQALLAQNRFSEATQQMDMVIAHVPDAKQTFAVADLALMMKDLDSAEKAYRKGATMPGGADRAKRGLDKIVKAREEARKNLTLADDLSRKGMHASAVDTYHAAIFANPRTPGARLGVAKALEEVSHPTPVQLREAATQFRAYVALEPQMPPKEQEKFLKKAEKLDGKATKKEEKAAEQS